MAGSWTTQAGHSPKSSRGARRSARANAPERDPPAPRGCRRTWRTPPDQARSQRTEHSTPSVATRASGGLSLAPAAEPNAHRTPASARPRSRPNGISVSVDVSDVAPERRVGRSARPGRDSSPSRQFRSRRPRRSAPNVPGGVCPRTAGITTSGDRALNRRKSRATERRRPRFGARPAEQLPAPAEPEATRSRPSRPRRTPNRWPSDSLGPLPRPAALGGGVQLNRHRELLRRALGVLERR